MKNQQVLTRRLNILSIAVIFIVLSISAYIMYNGFGMIEGLDFGPGQYYYTDIPNWDKIFFGENSINTGTQHPILFFGFFILWGLACFKFIGWIETRK